MIRLVKIVRPMLLLAVLMSIAADLCAESRLTVTMEKVTKGTVPDYMMETDINSDPTALVVVRSSLDGLDFSNNVVKVNKQVEDNGITFLYYVYLLDGTQKLDVSHDEYLHYEINFPERLKGNEMISDIIVAGERYDTQTAEIIDETGKHRVVIDYDDFATLYIDNQKVANRDSVFLEEGKHDLKAEYGKYSYSPNVDVKGRVNHVDALLSGEVVLKGVYGSPMQSALTPKGNYPDAELKTSHKGSYTYGHVLGQYSLDEYASTHAWVHKNITVDKRSHNVFRLDEMVGYLLVMYHGTHLQPFGLNIGYCKDFGGFVSWSTDLKWSVKTAYGKIDLKDKEGKDTFKSTAMTFSAGPMFKVFRKVYAQVGGGAVRYLRTGEKHILTGDYKYKWGGSACATIFYRFKNYIFGAGYTHQFVKGAYNPGLRNQVNFSIGWAKGQ